MKTPLFPWLFFISLFTAFIDVDVVFVYAQCQNDQRSSLLQLRKSLMFDPSASIKLVNWNSNSDCCDWAGITCDEDGRGRVTGLDLSYESINSGIDDTSGLCSLHYLRSLNLSFNNFNTSLPVRLANLTVLNYLNLSNAGFVGQIPIQISYMTSLVSLDLSTAYTFGNRSLKLEDPNLATLVQNLSQLTDLRLDGVNISSPGNEWCQSLSISLPNLKVMSLSNCFLSGPIDISLARLQSLSVIHLSNNNLSSSVPQFFANFSKLTALHLSSCELLGTFPETIFQIPTLEILDLSFNKLIWGSFPEFQQNLSLQTLVLSNTNFSGTLPESIGRLGKLSRIEIVNCSLIGSIPISLGNLTQLVHLDLSFNLFNGQIPSFRMSKNLIYVDLSHNHLMGEIPSSHWEGLLKLIYVDLRYNTFNGSIPSSLFAIPSLQNVQLSNNQFKGQIPEFPNATLSLLDTLDLSSNYLEGPIPSSVFDLGKLNVLVLSSNKLNGTIQLDQIQKPPHLTRLELSYNSLTVNASATNSAKSSFPKISTLRLASCNLRMFPILGNQSKLFHLDLSDNQIPGLVPGWISAAGSLQHLNLSFNLLVGLEKPFSLPILVVLDLHRNQLQGSIPFPPSSATYVDYSSNNFTFSIPPNIGNYLKFTFFFSLASNNLKGAIPQSICNALWLQVLDFSNNSLNGTIPSCLIERIEALHVLNLRRNTFNGSIPDKFPSTCKLKTLDLSGNDLQGQVPKSLPNCNILEVLDLGNNRINDVFPFLLKNISSLRVLVLRNNEFYGAIGWPQNSSTWPMLQIVDLASNKFTGTLPQFHLKDGKRSHDHIVFEPLRLNDGLHYQDSITVTSKGLELELVKILTVFTSIDFSSNSFEGPIPDVLGQSNALYALNLSRNALSGPIPSSLGDFWQLESLDLSNNHLSGQIPQNLASLTFLSFLNLSHNNLVGMIPIGSQFQTFSADSFLGNDGLCGIPVSVCSNTSGSSSAWKSNQREEFDWKFIIPAVGFGLGAGIVVAPFMFCKKLNKWFDDRVDKILMVLLPMLGLRYYSSGDWRIEPEDNYEEEDDPDNGDEEVEEEDNDDFGRRYCVFCSKLDISIKRVIHDPRCACRQSPPIYSSSSSFSSFSPF